MSAAQDVIYFCFSGDNDGNYKLNTNDDASLTSGIPKQPEVHCC